MTNTQLLKTFYTSFSNGDTKTMASCYSDDVVFEDPAFDKLKGYRAKAMWHMLLSRDSKPKLHLTL